MDIKRFIEELNLLSFDGFEDVEIGDAVVIPMLNECYLKQTFKHKIGILKRFLNCIFGKQRTFECVCKGDSKKNLFIFSGIFYRKDYIRL
ncbi:MAG: hypothetical protein LUI87_08705, partial [Lachnospiraceae bacterium]|nr:hypothetical protein [Lachnospiraceae bacterium]